MSNFKRKLSKVTGEIRFKPTLTSWDKTIEFAKNVEQNFEHWRIDNKRDVSLFNIESKSLIKIKYDSIMFLNEGAPANTEELLTNVRSLFTKLIEESDVKEFRHIGCRRQLIIETKFDYTDLTDLTFKKFYANQVFLKSVSGKNTLDTLFVLDSKKDGFRNHVQIGPTLKDQALQSFAQTFESKEILEDKSFLFFDIDVFKKEDIRRENALSVFDETVKENAVIAEAYIDYISN